MEEQSERTNSVLNNFKKQMLNTARFTIDLGHNIRILIFFERTIKMNSN